MREKNERVREKAKNNGRKENGVRRSDGGKVVRSLSQIATKSMKEGEET